MAEKAKFEWSGAIPRPSRAPSGKPAQLTAINCATLPDGKYSDAGNTGLRLVVNGTSRSWTLAFTSPTTGRRREIGLGRLDEVGLAKARKLAAKYRDDIRLGRDPLEAKAQRIAAGKAAAALAQASATGAATTLRRVVREYHEKRVEPERTRKHAQQWLNSIEQHVSAKLLDAPIATIRAGDILDELERIYRTVPETGRRVRQRLDAVLDHCVVREIVVANPVKPLGRELKKLFRERITTNWRALPFAEVPALVGRLRALSGTSARMLEFCVLTAARTSEVLGMQWSELSKDGKTWTVPAARMKAGEPHVVYLSDAARAVLDQVRGDSATWCFKSPERDAPLSNMAMLLLLRRLELDQKTTVHGVCRQSFSTWAYETNAARPDVVESALAHKEADRVKAAYNKAQFADERRELLAKWGAFVAAGKKGGRGNKKQMSKSSSALDERRAGG